MYTVREFAKKRINSGVFARFVLFLSGIDVTYDNNSGSPFYFTIEKQEDIRQIMSIIFSSTFKNMGKELFAGDNTYISIIQGEHKYNLHLLMNKEGKNYYAFATDDLQNKINELARNAGAYNKNTPQDPGSDTV